MRSGIRSGKAASRGVRASGSGRAAFALLGLMLVASAPARAEVPDYAYSVVARTAPPASMHPGEKLVLTVVLRNDGLQTWMADGASQTPFRLGASSPRERSSAFASADPTWLWSGGTRIRMTTPVAAPGQHATFTFTFTAPALESYPAQFDERFQPLAGDTWIDGPEISFATTVRPLVAAVPPLPNPEIPAPPPLPTPPPVPAPPTLACPGDTPRDSLQRGVSAAYGFGTVLPTAVVAPVAVTADEVGRLAVADVAASRAIRFTGEGTVTIDWASRAASGIALAPNGRVYVSDADARLINVYSSGGLLLTRIGSGLRAPAGLALAPDGSIAVADGDRVALLAPDGTLVRSIGEGTLSSNVTSVAIFDGMLFVADPRNDVIRRFTLGGDAAGAIGGTGSGVGCLSGPRGVAANEFGVFVADTGRNRIVHYTHAGLPLEAWGSAGTAAGRFDAPVSLAANGATIFVAELGNKRLQRFNPRAAEAPPLPCDGDPRRCSES